VEPRKTEAGRDLRSGRESLFRSLVPLVALALLVLVNILTVPNFGRFEIKDGRLFGAIIDILHRGTPVVLLAIGMTLVIATRGIDLSVGAVMAIAGAVSAVLLTRTGLSVPWVVSVALGASLAAGLWNGALVAYLKVQPIVATLILMVAGRGLAQLLTDGQIVTFENRAFEFIGMGSLLWLPVTVYIAAAAFIGTLFLTRKTVVGTYIEAVGGNETASVYSGINADRVKLFVYGFSGLCAGVAGLIATADIKAADVSNCGLYLELDAILSVVIGGTLFTGGKFNLAGSVIGALLIQTLTTAILMRGVGVEYTLVVKAVTVVLVCFIQSPAFQKTVLGILTPRRSSR
jgi:simple sugar transport system permease protein